MKVPAQLVDLTPAVPSQHPLGGQAPAVQPIWFGRSKQTDSISGSISVPAGASQQPCGASGHLAASCEASRTQGNDGVAVFAPLIGAEMFTPYHASLPPGPVCGSPSSSRHSPLWLSVSCPQFAGQVVNDGHGFPGITQARSLSKVASAPSDPDRKVHAPHVPPWHAPSQQVGGGGEASRSSELCPPGGQDPLQDRCSLQASVGCAVHAPQDPLVTVRSCRVPPGGLQVPPPVQFRSSRHALPATGDQLPHDPLPCGVIVVLHTGPQHRLVMSWQPVVVVTVVEVPGDPPPTGGTMLNEVDDPT